MHQPPQKLLAGEFWNILLPPEGAFVAVVPAEEHAQPIVVVPDRGVVATLPPDLFVTPAAENSLYYYLFGPTLTRWRWTGNGPVVRTLSTTYTGGLTIAPDGTHVAFVTGDGTTGATLYGDPDGNLLTIPGATRPVLLPGTGHLYVSIGNETRRIARDAPPESAETECTDCEVIGSSDDGTVIATVHGWQLLTISPSDHAGALPLASWSTPSSRLHISGVQFIPGRKDVLVTLTDDIDPDARSAAVVSYDGASPPVPTCTPGYEGGISASHSRFACSTGSMCVGYSRIDGWGFGESTAWLDPDDHFIVEKRLNGCSSYPIQLELVAGLPGGQPISLGVGAHAPATWTDATHLLYLQDSTLMLADLTGQAAPLRIADGVLTFALDGANRRIFLAIRNLGPDIDGLYLQPL